MSNDGVVYKSDRRKSQPQLINPGDTAVTRSQGSLNRTQTGKLFEGHLDYSPDKDAGQITS